MATFTTDLSNAIAAAAPGLDCHVLAMNDMGYHHAYPPRVRFELSEVDLGAYRRAADFLKMDEITELSERLVVMTAHGRTLLREVHGVPEDKIDLIPHGIPSVPFESEGKDRLGVEGRPVILTFGLLSPDKGIEHVIDALPAILARYPDVVYIVLGATHPHVRECHGETYRLMLESRAERLGVSASVIFHNRFVSQDELTEFLSAADIYVTPSVNPDQITSGTLAYAVGAGKAVISTPYIYARELLADGHGLLVAIVGMKRRLGLHGTVVASSPQTYQRAHRSLTGRTPGGQPPWIS